MEEVIVAAAAEEAKAAAEEAMAAEEARLAHPVVGWAAVTAVELAAATVVAA